MTNDRQSDIELIHAELRALRKHAASRSRALLEGVDVLLSVAESHINRVMQAVRWGVSNLGDWETP
jgi:restriction endonuclease S subunit